MGSTELFPRVRKCPPPWQTPFRRASAWPDTISPDDEFRRRDDHGPKDSTFIGRVRHGFPPWIAYDRMVERCSGVLAAATGLLAAALLIGGCGNGDGNDGPIPPGPVAECSDVGSWREAQDELDADRALEASLDDDLDGIACNDLAQWEHAAAWPGAYVEACEAVFIDAPDGFLHAGGIGYEQIDCENTDPGPAAWDGDRFSEPADDGREDAWMTACEWFFNDVGDDLYLGDDIAMSQTDCELAF